MCSASNGSVSSAPSQLRKFTAILAVIALALPFSLASAPAHGRSGRHGTSLPYSASRVRTGPTSTMMAMPLVAPIFFEDELYRSSLVLVNASTESTYATVTVRTLAGTAIVQEKIPLPASNQTRVPIADLLRSSGSTETRGSIVVEQSPELTGMAVLAQLSMTYSRNDKPAFIDEELAMPSPDGSAMLRAAGFSWNPDTLVAITSLSGGTQKVLTKCLTAGGIPRTNTLSLAPGATVLSRVCSGRADDSEDSGVSTGDRAQGQLGPVAVELSTSGMPGDFAAFGLSQHNLHNEATEFASLPFTDPMMAQSSATVFTGVPIGPTRLLGGTFVPNLVVANFSGKSAHVTVNAGRSLKGPLESETSSIGPQTLIVPPLQTVLYPMTELQGDAEMRNSLIVESDASPGDVAANVLSVARSETGLSVGLLGKDFKDTENAGAHPWTVDRQSDSTLFLFNQTDQPQKVIVTVASGPIAWRKTLTLNTLETQNLDIGALILKGTPDDTGKRLPKGLAEGEVFWSSKFGTTKGRLLVSNIQNHMARNFSCGGYAVLCGATISPTSYTLTEGQNATFNGNTIGCVGYSQLSCGGPSGYSPGGDYSWTAATPMASPNCSGDLSCTDSSTGVGSGSISFEATNGSCFFSATSTVTSNPPSATISLRTSGSVSSDDAALPNYESAEGTTSLGPIIGNGAATPGCFVGLEAVGAISPSSYTGNVILHRQFVSDALYTNSTKTGGSTTPQDDTSIPGFRDDDPQSGGSAGKVYDLDAPGTGTTAGPGSNIYRYRGNFYEYATLPDGTTISSNNNFYVRVSCVKTTSGYQFVNDLSGDNQIGSGTTKLTWNFQ
jgi:hypothetical protein